MFVVVEKDGCVGVIDVKLLFGFTDVALMLVNFLLFFSSRNFFIVAKREITLMALPTLKIPCKSCKVDNGLKTHLNRLPSAGNKFYFCIICLAIIVLFFSL